MTERLTRDSFTRALHPRFQTEDPGYDGKLLEDAHVRAIQQMFEAFARSDLTAFLDDVHPDVDLEIFAPADFPWIRRARGLAKFRAAVEHNFAAHGAQRPEVLNVVAQGNIVVLIARERRRLRESVQEFDMHFAYEFTFRDGKVWRIRELQLAKTTGVVAALTGPAAPRP